jgi:hypothetical protein
LISSQEMDLAVIKEFNKSRFKETHILKKRNKNTLVASSMNGPPLSPWQESFPPSGRPAQIMESATSACPYALRQSSSDTTGTVTFFKLSGRVADPS